MAEHTQNLDLQKIWEQVAKYARALWRLRWYGFILSLALTVGGWLFVLMIPPKYEASARVYVDTESLLKPLLSGLAVEPNVMDYVTLMTQTLVTRPHLEQVIRDVDLDLGVKSQTAMEALVVSLADRISIKGSRESVFTISFTDANRLVALKVVQELVNSFVEKAIGSGFEDTEQAESTLLSELRGYEQRLVEAENRLRDFKRENVGLMPGENRDYYSELQAANKELQTLEQKIRIESEKARSLQAQLAEVSAIPDQSDLLVLSGPGTQYDDQIRLMEKRKSELLIDYTEAHPEVVRVTQALEDLYTRRSAALASLPGRMSQDEGLADNPVYQNMRIAYSKVQVELASLQARYGDQKAEVNRLRGLVDVIPEVEAELNRLNRDYDVVKARYTAMLSRWENLQTGKRVDNQTEQVQFRVISPPYAPLKPAGPPRWLLVLATALLALAAAAGLVILYRVLRPVVLDQDDLRSFGRPVIGVISSQGATPLMPIRQVLTFSAGMMLYLAMTVGMMQLASEGSEIVRQFVSL